MPVAPTSPTPADSILHITQHTQWHLPRCVVLDTARTIATLPFKHWLTVILAQPPPAVDDNAAWGLRSLLAEDANDNDGVLVKTVDDPPCRAFVHNPQFVAPSSNPRHRAVAAENPDRCDDAVPSPPRVRSTPIVPARSAVTVSNAALKASARQYHVDQAAACS